MRQKGFTLLELIIAVGISSLVVLTGVGFIFQAFATTGNARSYNTILVQLDVATSQIRKDLYMAHDTGLAPGVPQSRIDITWTNYTATSNSSTGVPYSSSYTINGTNLVRTYDDSENVSVSIIGRNITNITFTQNAQNERFIDVVITATSNGTRPIVKSIEFSAYRRSVGVD